MFCRNQSSRATVARGSAVEMEVRRGRVRLSVFEESAQERDVQREIEREMRVRDGAFKLLAACSQRDQALEASKSLLSCNARVLALMSQLQRVKETQALQRTGRRSSDGGTLDGRVPCSGKVAISDIRIPLIWKDSEYFKNKGDLHRCAVFCLLSVGSEIYDTHLVMVDRTLTDICFDDTVIFTDVPPHFELRLELYSCHVEGDSTPGQAPRRLARLSGSLSRSSGKRLRAALESATACGLNVSATADGDVDGDGDRPVSPTGSPVHVSTPTAQGPKYQLLAHTSLTLAQVENSFRTHDLTVPCTEESSFWLPLYGSVCCRLVSQPNCMTQLVMKSKLKIQQPGEDPDTWSEVYGVLKGTELLCYHRQDDVESLENPAFTIPINKETRIRAKEKEPFSDASCILITSQSEQEEVTHKLVPHTQQEIHSWMEAFWQHFYNISQWKQCCDELMKIEVPSPRKLVLKHVSQNRELGTTASVQPRDTLTSQNSPVSTEIQALLQSYYNSSS